MRRSGWCEYDRPAWNADRHPRRYCREVRGGPPGHHYLGFAETQWRLFEKEAPRRAKTLLYVYRVLLTGIHLMRTGRIEANLAILNEDFRLPYVADLIAQKTHLGERSAAAASDVSFQRSEFSRPTA